MNTPRLHSKLFINVLKVCFPFASIVTYFHLIAGTTHFGFIIFFSPSLFQLLAKEKRKKFQKLQLSSFFYIVFKKKSRKNSKNSLLSQMYSRTSELLIFNPEIECVFHRLRRKDARLNQVLIENHGRGQPEWRKSCLLGIFYSHN